MNNKAKYETFLVGFRAMTKVGATKVEVCSDSKLVFSQLQWDLVAREERMSSYLKAAKQLQSQFAKDKVRRIFWGKKNHADSLTTMASSAGGSLPRVISMELVDFPKILHPKSSQVLRKTSPSWIDPMLHIYQMEHFSRIGRRSKRWEGNPRGTSCQQRRSFTSDHMGGTYLLCVHPDIVDSLLYKLHEGICGSHTVGYFLAHKAMSQGYWWSNMQRSS